MIDCIGGHSNSSCLIDLYERLLYAEESSVRERALEGLKQVLAVYETKKKEGEVISLVKRLANSEFSSAKSMAPQLIVIASPYLSASFQADLYKYSQLIRIRIYRGKRAAKRPIETQQDDDGPFKVSDTLREKIFFDRSQKLHPAGPFWGERILRSH